MITKRQLELINEIIGNKKINICDMANLFNITERSLRNDVSNINEIFMTKFNIKLLDIKSNYIISLLTEEKIKYYFFNLSKKEYSLNSLEREILISLDILLFKNTFKLKEFIEEYDISKSTLRNILRKIEKKFIKYDIFLKKNNTGYYIVGEEFSIRKLIINLIRVSKTTNKKNIILKNLINNRLDKFNISISIFDSKEKLKNFLEKDNLKISDETFNIIYYYIFLSYNRNNFNFIITDNEIKNRNFLENTSEYQRIKSYFYKDKYFLNNDCLILTDFYLGLYKFNENYSFFANWVFIEQFVDKFLLNLSEEFKLDFRNDTILRSELINHIKPAIYRMKNKLELCENISSQVKDEYKDLYYKTEKSLKYIEDILNIELDEDEVSFITIMVKRSIDRIKNIYNYKKIKVLIVCGFGYSTSKLISEQLLENFEIEIKDLIPFNKLSDYGNLHEIDLIVSTLDFTLNTHDVIKVNPILKDNDIEVLKNYGLKKRNTKISEKELIEFILENKNKDTKEISENIRKKYSNYIYKNYRENIEKRIYDFLEERDVILNSNLDNLDDVLKLIGKRMYENNYTNKNYYKNLKNQIDKYGSYILVGEKTILPHGEIKKNVNKTGFILVTLNNYINFFGKEINVVLALASKNKDDHLKAILDINSLLKIKDFEDKLLFQKNYKELIKFIKKTLKEIEDENS